MSSAEEAAKCIHHLHRTELHGRMISVEKVGTINLYKQGSKNPLVRSYLRVPQAAGQVIFWMISNVN